MIGKFHTREYCRYGSCARPSREASRLLQQAYRAQMQGNFVEAIRLYQESIHTHPTQEIEAQIAAVAAEKRRRPLLVLALDGASGPLRAESARGSRPGRKKQRAKRARWQGEGHEAKGFRCSLVAGDPSVHLLSWHQVQSQEELFAALERVKVAGLIPEE